MWSEFATSTCFHANRQQFRILFGNFASKTITAFAEVRSAPSTCALSHSPLYDSLTMCSASLCHSSNSNERRTNNCTVLPWRTLCQCFPSTGDKLYGPHHSIAVVTNRFLLQQPNATVRLRHTQIHTPYMRPCSQTRANVSQKKSQSAHTYYTSSLYVYVYGKLQHQHMLLARRSSEPNGRRSRATVDRVDLNLIFRRRNTREWLSCCASILINGM